MRHNPPTEEFSMNNSTLLALRWAAAALLAGPVLAHAQDAPRSDTTSAAARQSAAAERHDDRQAGHS